MTRKDSRRSGCPISFSLDLFGDRWTLLILRDLLLKKKSTFQDFLEAEEGIASNILADRLKKLEQAGLIKKSRNREDRRQFRYGSTPEGQSLVPVLLEIAAWGASHDKYTEAPKDFAKSFYADRDKVIADFKR